MNFQYFVVTLRLFVLTHDKDLRSENESSPRRSVTSVTTSSTRSRQRRSGRGLAILLWKPYLLYEDVRELKRQKSYEISRFLNFLNEFSIFRGDAPAFRTNT